MANFIDNILSADPNMTSTNGVGPQGRYTQEDIGVPSGFQTMLEAILRGKWVILLVFAVVSAAAYFYTASIPDQYRATAMVFVNRSAGLAQTGGLVSFGAENRDIANELILLKTRTLSERVAEALLERYSEQPMEIMTDESGSLLDVATIAERILGRVSSQQVLNTDHINLSTTSTSPEEARLLADEFSSAYVEWRLESSRGSMNQALEFLREQEAVIQDTLERSQQELGDFLEANEAFNLDEQATNLVGRIATMQMERDKANLDLEVARAQLGSLQRQVNEISPGLERRIASSEESTITSLRELIAKKEIDLQNRYALNPGLEGNEHNDPVTKALMDEITRLKRNLSSLVGQFVENNGAALIGTQASGSGDIRGEFAYLGQLQQRILEQQLEINRHSARLGVFNRQLGGLEGQKRTLPDRSIRLAELEQRSQATQGFYSHITDRIQEIQLAAQADVGDIELVENASRPSVPFSPNRRQNILMGMMLGLALGVGFVFVRAMLDQSIRTPEELRSRRYNVLGVIPDMSSMIKKDFGGNAFVSLEGLTVSTSLPTLLSPMNPLSESFRELRTNVTYAGVDKAVKLIMVTSPLPGEGKSVTSMNLAVAMAQSGLKTLIIDADLRRPLLHTLIGAHHKPGLTDYLVGTPAANLSTAVDNLSIIPTGRRVPNASEFLGSAALKQLLLQVRDSFDVVIVDTPPVLAVTDALLLAPLVDAILVVASAGETQWGALKRTTEKFRAIGQAPSGIVLNRFSEKRAYGYSGYYYKKYGYGYHSYREYSQ